MRTLSYFLSAVRGNFATIPDKSVHRVFSRGGFGVRCLFRVRRVIFLPL
jgi:hypothetical protein